VSERTFVSATGTTAAAAAPTGSMRDTRRTERRTCALSLYCCRCWEHIKTCSRMIVPGSVEGVDAVVITADIRS